MFVVLCAVVMFALAACSELEVGILDDGIVDNDDPLPDPDPDPLPLPDGFVDTNRPPLASLSFEPPCPLNQVPGGHNNANVTLGCPTTDCIPAVDNPQWGTIARVAGKLLDFERMMVIERDGMVRGIPIKILIHHEVVNVCWKHDDGSESYSVVTYCPIVDVAVHFDRDFPCGRTRRFSYGVSSGIYNGNLIIYQRGTAGTTDGVFVQMYGGGLNTDCLDFEMVNLDMTWAMFRRLYPKAEVMTENTGSPPTGGYDAFQHPYKEFWASPDLCVNGLCFPVSSTDDRLQLKDLVFGLYTPSSTKAYPLDIFKTRRVVNDRVGGQKAVIWHHQNAVAAFEAQVDGVELRFTFLGRDKRNLPLFEDEETRSIWTFDGICVQGDFKGRRLSPVLGYRAFWFAWSAFFPGSLIHET
jgi:hypothetical protein